VAATGTLVVDGEGRLVNFRARRFNTTTRTLETWETPMSRHDERAGVRVPVEGSAVWKLADGDFAYIELSIDAVSYDP
jgi:hypothetical protein